MCPNKANDNLSVVPAHQSIDGRGIALKPNDYHALPLCAICHGFEHMGSKTFWKGINKEKLIIDYLIKYIQENNL